MELAQAIEIAVQKTGHKRFRDLLDPSHRDYNPHYEGAVRRIAEGLPLDATPIVAGNGIVPTVGQRDDDTVAMARGTYDPAQMVEWRRLDVLVNACPHRGCKTGCGNAECSAGKGDQGLGGTVASITHCRQCVSQP